VRHSITAGFSPRNLKYMRKFAECWPDHSIVQRTVAQFPWRSNLALLDKLQDTKTRLWYTRRTIEYGWGGISWSKKHGLSSV
jgi:hypothetical protein